jgi:peptidoglycan/xylan/chitin deacetylase (PgdA/CDA1 family)
MKSNSSKIAYLTIDDSPSKDMQEKVDYLIAHQIPAIWYCRGEFMEQHLSSVVYAIERGFWIGNHSYTHPYFSQILLEEAMQEIIKTDYLIEQAYRLAGIPRDYKLFRFPFGDKGGGKNYLKEYSNSEKEHVEALQHFLKREGFQKANFEGITYSYYFDAGQDQYLDAPWTFDTKDYVALSKNSQEKSKLLHIEDFLSRMDLHDPEKGLGLNDPDSNDIVILHDFEKTTFLFQPLINKLLTKNLIFQLPRIDANFSS